MQTRLELAGDCEHPHEQAHRERSRLLRRLLVVMAALAATLLLVFGVDWADGRAIRGLPESSRHALYLRTVENLKTVCTTGNDGLRDFCVEQANLAMQFPECDKACRALAFAQISRVQIPR